MNGNTEYHKQPKQSWGKNGAEGIRLPDFRLYYKATIITTVWYWHKKEIYINGAIESPEINPCTYAQLICDKGVKNIQ